MYVCICNAVSEKRIRQAVAEGADDFESLQEATCVATCCGCCESEVRNILEDALDEQMPSRHYRAA
ncbi:MAG TPA: (2Fe-2S)-binding protein [Gammaproteobacteria bacterium]|nr:(2Fe-2S)-binding protein [Gammaproteobacteria bacterium]